MINIELYLIPLLIGLLAGSAIGGIIFADPRKRSWNITALKPLESNDLWKELDKFELRSRAEGNQMYQGLIDTNEKSYWPGQKSIERAV